jgi:prepilin-type N-terminal cleavage/methylation domain-containing protein
MNKSIIKGHQGFSLIEIMVALLLVSTIFMLIPMGVTMSDRQKLEEVVDEFDRAIRFAQNESILRNAIVRLNIKMDTDPVEYAVEFGPGGNLVLPTVEDISRMSLSERETQDKKQQNLDGQFSKVAEFSEENKKIQDGVQVLGIASSYLKSIMREGSLSIYFYPTGEKDDALIYFSTETEMATLDVPAFEAQTYADYYLYSDAELATLDDSQENKMKELYDQWIKN